MSDNIWTSYAERRPTIEDSDNCGGVMAIDGEGYLCRLFWAAQCNPTEAWARTADILRATGYVKPRKLHPAWRELRPDSWAGVQEVWLLNEKTPKPAREYCLTNEAIRACYTRWLPAPPPPPVWEDEA